MDHKSVAAVAILHYFLCFALDLWEGYKWFSSMALYCCSIWINTMKVLKQNPGEGCPTNVYIFQVN
jgi:hypothetical protein